MPELDNGLDVGDEGGGHLGMLRCESGYLGGTAVPLTEMGDEGGAG